MRAISQLYFGLECFPCVSLLITVAASALSTFANCPFDKRIDESRNSFVPAILVVIILLELEFYLAQTSTSRHAH